MRWLILLLLLAGIAQADPPRSLQVVEPGPTEMPRLVLPPDLLPKGLVGPGEAYRDSPGSPLLAGVALALAAVLFGFRIAGKTLPVPRLAFGTGLTLLLLAGFSGCGAGQPEVILDASASCAPLVGHEDGLQGEVLLERGQDDTAVRLVAPASKLRDLARP